MANTNFKSLRSIGSSAAAPGATEGAATGVAPGAAAGAFSQPPDPEVSEIKPRRNFTAHYKMRIVKEADNCTEPGQIGALLRREGLYSSNLASWRRQFEKGLLDAMADNKRGRKKNPKNPLADRLKELEQENNSLKQKLKKAEIIIDVQKKISEILNIDQLPKDGKS